MAEEKEYETVAQVAKRQGVQGQTVRDWCKHGLIAHKKVLGKRRHGVWMIEKGALPLPTEKRRGPEQVPAEAKGTATSIPTPTVKI